MSWCCSDWVHEIFGQLIRKRSFDNSKANCLALPVSQNGELVINKTVTDYLSSKL